jgi:hypothetical protein
MVVAPIRNSPEPSDDSLTGFYDHAAKTVSLPLVQDALEHVALSPHPEELANGSARSAAR